MDHSKVGTPSNSSAIDTSDDFAHIPASNLQFPWKLHVVLAKLEVTGQDDVMSWVPGSSTAFQIHDRKRFMAEVMPQFFSSKKYKSFQRNLNLWGFKAETKEPLKGAFSHPYFVRNRPDLCHSMKRSCNSAASAVPKTLARAKAMKKAKAEAAASSSPPKPRQCLSFKASVSMNRKAAPPAAPPSATPSAPINLGALSSSQQQEALMLLAAVSSDPQHVPTQLQARLASAKNAAAASTVRTSPLVSSGSLPQHQQQQQQRQQQQQQQPSASDVTAALQQVLVHLNQQQQHQQLLRQRSVERRAQEAVTNLLLQHLISQGQPQRIPSLPASGNHPHLAGLGAVMANSTSSINNNQGMSFANQKTDTNPLNTILQELHRRGT